MDTNVLITAMWIGLVIGVVVSAVLTLMTLPASYLMNTFAYHHWSFRLGMMLAMFLPFIISATTLWLSSPLLIPWSLIALVPNLLLLFTVGAWKRAHYYGLFPLYEAAGKPIESTGFAASIFKFFLLLIHPVVMVTDTEAITKSLGSLIVKDLPPAQEIDGKKYYPGIVNEDFTRLTMAAGKLKNGWDTTMESLTKVASVIYGSAGTAAEAEEEEEEEEEEQAVTSEMSENPLAPILKRHREEILTAIAETEEHYGALIGTLTDEHKKKIVGAVSAPYKEAMTAALAAKTLPAENRMKIMEDITKLSKDDQDQILLDVANTLLKQKNYKIIGDIANNLDEAARDEIIKSIPQEQQAAILMTVASGSTGANISLTERVLNLGTHRTHAKQLTEGKYYNVIQNGSSKYVGKLRIFIRQGSVHSDYYKIYFDNNGVESEFENDRDTEFQETTKQ